MMVGKIGTHKLLRVPSQDSVVRPWGLNLHNHDLESHCGTHRVALMAVHELETQAEAKYHMYCFI
jgi:hypothetical protein